MPSAPKGEDREVTKPQQSELARTATPPAGPVPEDNLPGHRPDHDQDKPEGPPPTPKPKPRARKAKPESVQGAATATMTERVVAAVDAAQPDAASLAGSTDASFAFEFDPRVAPLSYAVGVTPWTSKVEVRDGELCVRFGIWSLTTELDNIEAAEVTGPYQWLKIAGPPRLSLSDRGITFATTTRRGVCIKFREPVSVLVPLLKHPALTVTVDDPDALVRLLTR